MSNILIARDGPVSIITINRPERRNAVDGATASIPLAPWGQHACASASL